MPSPENAVALITGGSRGIGAAINERLQADGLTTVTLGRTSGDVQADIGDADSVQAAFEQVREQHGPVVVLVNNAGERRDGLTIRMSAEDWEAVVNTNLNGAFHCTRRALDDMLKARWGRIVNVSSVVALHHAELAGRLKPGDTVALAAFGGGFVWGAGIVKWKERVHASA